MRPSEVLQQQQQQQQNRWNSSTSKKNDLLLKYIYSIQFLFSVYASTTTAIATYQWTNTTRLVLNII